MVKTGTILKRKINREIYHSFRQFLSIIAIAGLAICLFVGLSANASVFEKRVNKLYQDGNMADLFISVSNYEKTDMEELSKINGIDEIEERLVLGGISCSSNVKIMTNDPDNILSQPSQIYDGEKGFLITKEFANRNTVKIGDSIEFLLPTSFGITEKTQLSLDMMTNSGINPFREEYITLKFKVTGIMLHPECVDATLSTPTYFFTSNECFREALKSMVLGYFNPSYQNAILPMIDMINQPNQYIVKVNSEKNIDSVNTKINNYFDDKQNSNLVSCVTIDNLSTNSGLMSDIIQAKKLTIVFPTIFFLVSLLIIVTTISQIILRERTQIGTMKAIGLSDKMILNHYMRLTITSVLIGTVFGIVVGPLLLPNVMNQKYKILFSLPKLEYVFPLLEIIGCMLLMFGLTCLVCYMVCKDTIKEMPANSMHGIISISPKKMKIDDKIKTNKKNMTIKMAIRNIMVKKGRSVMVIVGVAGCIALLICGFGIEDTLENGVNNDFYTLMDRDIDVAYSSISDSVKENIEKLDGVEEVEEYTIMPTVINAEASYQTIVRVVENNTERLNVSFNEGEVAISQKIANELNVGVGDVIKFTILGETYSAKVGKVYKAFYFHGLVLKKGDYPELAKHPNNAWVMVEDEKMDALETEIGQIQGVTSSLNKESYQSHVNDMISSISLMTATIKVFAILLAIVVLYNIALLNYKERYKDIATLKVLGFNQREIANTLIIEIMILTIIGGIIGMFLGYPVMVLVLSINETPLVSFLYYILTKSYVISFLLTIFTSLVINVLLSLMTNKIKMVESLKAYE